MSEPFVGEIRMFAGNFAPRGWALCDGQLLAVSQNDALFSLFGTIYGGDGRTTFGLPGMRGRIPVHHGTGPGLTNIRLGTKGGQENVTLTTNQLPSHTHSAASSGSADSVSPAGNIYATSASGDWQYSDQNLQVGNNTTESGGNQRHGNMPPFQCIHFIVALVGIYPSRS